MWVAMRVAIARLNPSSPAGRTTTCLMRVRKGRARRGARRDAGTLQGWVSGRAQESRAGGSTRGEHILAVTRRAHAG
eukprot:3377450-Alexandrium_andersonii.AAC.1